MSSSEVNKYLKRSIWSRELNYFKSFSDMNKILRFNRIYVVISGVYYVISEFWKYIRTILLSQTAACDGTLYQVIPEDDNTLPGQGVPPV